ncbi:MAG: DUF1573 domain-containing protein [Bacteroidaceae bacterium]|nr:DUF1573 domain-containing protein [Bacteroidaceae bacterium]
MNKSFFILSALMLWQVAAIAQPRFIPNTETQKVGQVEWKHPLTVKYSITNGGDQPLVLTDVQPDCDCTAVKWTETPIAPNGKGEIDVTFDASILGTFDKGVAVYTNAEPHVTYLRFTGQVMMEIKDYTRTHPYKFGDVRIDTTEVSFSDVQRGTYPTMRIGVANEGDRPYEPVLMHLPSYMTQKAEPAVLQPYEHGEIVLTLESDLLDDYGLTQGSVYLSRFQGDVVGQDNEVPLSVVLLPDFSSLSPEVKSRLPVIDLATQEVDLSAQLAKKTSAKQDIMVGNRGQSPLMILKVQVFNSALGVDLKKNVLEPGETTKMRISVNKRAIDRDRRHLRVLLITNDIQHPKVEINIKAY